MRVGIDARLIEGEHYCGIKTYTQNLVSHLAEIDKKNEYLIFSPKLTRLPKQKNFKLKLIRIPLPPPRSVFYTQVVLPLIIRQEKLDIVHFLNNTAPLLPLGKVKTVLTLHDIIDLLPLPVASAPRFQSLHHYQRLVVPRNMEAIDLIITPSFESKEKIVKILRVNEKKIKVIYEGIEDVYKKLLQPEVENFKKKKKLGKFFLTLGSFSPRKNLKGVLKAFFLLPPRLKKVYQLVVVLSFPTLKKSLIEQASKLKIEESLIFIESPSSEELALLYNAALALVFPSLYEGFGLPALESMACGTPVIASNLSSFPEILGKAAILVNPKKIDEIAGAMEKMISWSEREPSRYQDLVERGYQQKKKFDWQKMAQQTFAVYKQSLKTCL